MSSTVSRAFGSRTRFGPLLLLISAMLAAGCTPPTRLESVWKDEVARAGPFDNVLVIGVSTNFDQRERFEAALASTLNNRPQRKTAATASSTRMAAAETLSRESVENQVSSIGADAVLVTRFVSQEIEIGETPGRMVMTPVRRNEYVHDFFRYDYRTHEEPAMPVTKATVHLATDLYATATGALVYSINSTSFDKESEAAVFDEVVKAIAGRLARDGLIH